MKNLLPLFLIFCAIKVTGQAFITTWKTDNQGISASNQITIPTTGTGYNYSITWEKVGNAAINGAIPGPITGNHTITFPDAGTYRVSITGAFPRIYFNGNPSNVSSDCDKILSIEQWGSTVWKSMASAFKGCGNLTIPAIDAPNLSEVTDMSYMFAYATSFNQLIDHWDVSSVASMNSMFYAATNFNQPIGAWDVGNVMDMSWMFYTANNFNQPIGAWDVSSVTNMHSMFNGATIFNQPIGTWNVSSVTDMSWMFYQVYNFNQPIGTWNVGNVQYMSWMFGNANNFNQPIGAWDVSRALDMSYMFYVAVNFNQPIGAWNVSSVTNMNGMFIAAINFNQPIGAWDVSSVTNMSGMFGGPNGGATNFNQPIEAWDVSHVTNMSSMFELATNFNQSIGAWDLANVTDMSRMLYHSGLDVYNYDQTLIGWAAQNVKSNIPLGALGLKYCTGAAARTQLITNKGWVIDGDTKIAPSEPILLLTQPVCPGSTGTISVTIENTDDIYSFNNGVTFQTSNILSGLAVGTYAVIVKNNMGCSSTATPAVINPPFDKSPAPFISGSSIVCPNVAAVDYSASIQGYNYTWFINGGTLLSQQNNQIKINWGPSNFYAAVKAVGFDEHNCPTDTAVFPVKIQIKLKPTLPIGMDSVCFNFRAGVPYKTSFTNGSVYTWFTDGGVIAEGQTTPLAKIDWFDIGQYELWVKEENQTSTDYCEGNSDTLHVTVFKDVAAITMKFVSVDYTDDKKVQIHWDVSLLERVSDLVIVSRRIAASNTPWETVAILQKDVQLFLDQNVQTGENIYEYRVEGFNKCDEVLQTVIHNTIKLDGDKDEAQELIDLFWNDYNGWDGVERYEVWRKLDNDITFKLIDITPGDITNYIGKHGGDGFVHTLRIKAKKQNENTISWSNEIKLDFENPIDFIPNVITPNGDTKNEYFFIPRLNLYPENHLSIYDRWGKSVFARSDYENNWNANGLPEGIYYYTLFIKKNNSTMKGWVQVVR